MSMRVLVFDDDSAIARLVVRVAALSGLYAHGVSDAPSFEERLQSDPPEVVLLDMQLGDTDGVEQMRLLAARQYDGALVLMSGYDARVLATARALGESLGLKLEHVLEKPLKVAELEQVFGRLQVNTKPQKERRTAGFDPPRHGRTCAGHDVIRSARAIRQSVDVFAGLVLAVSSPRSSMSYR